MRIKNLILFTLSLGLYSTITLAVSPLDPIKEALKAKEYGAAYQRAHELLDTYAGDPQFDYWYGKAAYSAGHYEAATFAFERVLIAEPGHTPARYYLGLTYQKMGHPEFAKPLLEGVKLPPSPKK